MAKQPSELEHWYYQWQDDTEVYWDIRFLVDPKKFFHQTIPQTVLKLNPDYLCRAVKRWWTPEV